ncbi:MAG TPA: hypothetical protein VFW07_12345 [Parafilimonas sp.]|nr:hypothetical protein [Parafilimonas sp.]
MKTSITKFFVAAVFLAMIVIVNTGCPHSAQKTTRPAPNDSTQGSPPK